MNKCCVKNKECEHANSYGVCRLSNLYDCKPADDTEYIDWKKKLLEEEENKCLNQNEKK